MIFIITFNKSLRYLVIKGRSQWSRGLKRRSKAARLLQSWVGIPPRAWTFVCFVLSATGFCDELITRPEESYRLWRVAVCDKRNLVNGEAMARAGLQSQRKYRKTCLNRTPIYRKPGQTENKFRN
jgi:hypothetical protein